MNPNYFIAWNTEGKPLRVYNDKDFPGRTLWNSESNRRKENRKRRENNLKKRLCKS